MRPARGKKLQDARQKTWPEGPRQHSRPSSCASQLLGLGLAAAPATSALAEDLGTLTVSKATSYSDFDDVNDSFSRMHHFEVNSEDGIAYCGAKSLHSPEAGRVFTGGYVSNNPALDWIMCHGWSPTHQTEYGLSSSHFMMATQYVVWFALPHSYETNDHDWAESELTRIYIDVADAVAKMRAESAAYVAAGGGGPEAGSSIIWPSPDDATQSLVTRRTPQVEVAMQKGSADASLTFGNDAYSLAGATYEIRQCADDALAATVTTDATGRASCSLRPGVRYYAQETRAPAGYLLASGRVEFEAKAGQVVGLDDVPATAEVRVQKVDSSTGGAAQPGASLAGTELTLIDAQGRTHVSTTDAEGRASFDGLPLGRVRVTESRAPEGYKASQQVLEAEAAAAQVGQNGIASISMESVLARGCRAFGPEIAKFKDYGQEGSGLEQPAGGVPSRSSATPRAAWWESSSPTPMALRTPPPTARFGLAQAPAHPACTVPFPTTPRATPFTRSSPRYLRPSRTLETGPSAPSRWRTAPSCSTSRTTTPWQPGCRW